MTKFLLIAALLVVASSCAKTTFVRSAPNYSASLVRAKNISLLPPEVEVNQVDILSKKTRIYNYEDRLEEIITNTLVELMYNKGYDVKILSRSQIGSGKLSRYVVDTKEEFKEVAAILYNGKFWSHEKAYSIDHKIRSAAELGKKTKADLLIMLDFYAENKTSAAVTKELIQEIIFKASAQPTEFSTVRVAIIDSLTGQVLWTHLVTIYSDIMESTMNSFSDGNEVDKSKIMKLLQAALADLPSARHHAR